MKSWVGWLNERAKGGLLKAWPRWHRTWFIGILAAYWIAQASFSIQLGKTPYLHTDSSTEGMTIYAAKHYVSHGFFENYLLPTYPPFGNDPKGNPRTEPFVYTHYMAAQDILMAAIMKVVPETAAIVICRLIPLTLTVFGMGLLGLGLARVLGSSLMGCVFTSLLFIPRSLTAWSICLYGHSYVLAWYLILVGALLWLVRPERGPMKKETAEERRAVWALGLCAGFLQMQFALDWVPASFLALMGFVVMNPRLPESLGRRVLAAFFIGATAAALYQLTLSSLYYGSLKYTVLNLVQWGTWRTGAHGAVGVDPSDLLPHRVLQEMNRQAYGATGFTAFNLAGLALMYLLLGFAGKALTRSEFQRGFLGLFLTYLGSVTWTLGMRQHTLAHIRFISRHYFVLYLALLLIALPVAYRLAVRSRSLRGEPSVA